MNTNQVHANFRVIDQLAADQGSLAGNVEGIRSQLRKHAQEALGTLDGGMGTEEHEACMRKVDQLIDEYIRSTQDMQRTTGQVNQTMMNAGNRARSILGSGA
jgi:uncharacterized protein YukE